MLFILSSPQLYELIASLLVDEHLTIHCIFISSGIHICLNQADQSTRLYGLLLRPARPPPCQLGPCQCLATPKSLTHCPPWTRGRPVIGNQCSVSVPLVFIAPLHAARWPSTLSSELLSISGLHVLPATDVCSLGQTLPSALSLLLSSLYGSSANAPPQWPCWGPL